MIIIGGDDYYLNGGYVKLQDAGKGVGTQAAAPETEEKPPDVDEPEEPDEKEEPQEEEEQKENENRMRRPGTRRMQ